MSIYNLKIILILIFKLIFFIEKDTFKYNNNINNLELINYINLNLNNNLNLIILIKFNKELNLIYFYW